MNVLEMHPFIQAEGHQYGALQFMVRVAGCGVMDCPIRPVCDEPGALKFTGGAYIPAEDIVAEAARHVGHHGWIHVSGGEPCNQPRDLVELQQVAHRRHMKIHIQTSGTIKVPCKWDWLTVSPKAPPDDLLQRFGQELKVVFDPSTINLNALAKYYHTTKFSDYYLQPLWVGDDATGRNNAEETLEVVQRMNRCGMPWKMSVQWHKWLGFK